MAKTIVDRAVVEAFLDVCGNTNFQVIARGRGPEGSVTPTLKKETKYYSPDDPKTTVYRQANGLRSGVTVDGKMRVYRQAASFADGDDWYRAIVALVECGYYDQVELHALEHISISGEWGERKNPVFGDLEPLIWRCEDDGSVTTHGGAREGAGRPSLGGKPVLVDMPVEMISELNAKAKERGVARAELVREAVRKLLAE